MSSRQRLSGPGPAPAPAPVAPPAPEARLGYDATAVATEERVLPMLACEPVVWLSMVRPDGLPHLVPTWFWWDGEALVVFSKPDAVKVRNLRANPRLMVAVGDPAQDFSVGLIEAEATCEDAPVAVPDGFLRKYAARLADGRLDAETFRATYTQAIRIVPTRLLAWHGRGAAHERAAARPGWTIRLAGAVRGLGAFRGWAPARPSLLGAWG